MQAHGPRSPPDTKEVPLPSSLGSGGQSPELTRTGTPVPDSSALFRRWGAAVQGCPSFAWSPTWQSGSSPQKQKGGTARDPPPPAESELRRKVAVAGSARERKGGGRRRCRKSGPGSIQKWGKIENIPFPGQRGTQGPSEGMGCEGARPAPSWAPSAEQSCPLPPHRRGGVACHSTSSDRNRDPGGGRSWPLFDDSFFTPQPTNCRRGGMGPAPSFLRVVVVSHGTSAHMAEPRSPS